MLAAIGGVSIRHWYHVPEFYWRAGRALRQAQADPACGHAEVFRHDGLYFSLSVWRDADAMLGYARSGPHRGVMQAAHRLAHVYTFHHFECDTVPSTEQAVRAWTQNTRAAE